MDLATLLVFASGEAADKAPFYVLGGALAVWAVVLSALGLSRADFPGSATRERGVIGLTALLVAATLVAAVLTASG